MNVRTIVAALALLSLLSTATGGYLFYYSARESALNEAEREFLAVSEGLKAQIQRMVSAYKREAAVLARFVEFSNALTEGKPEDLTHANRILDNFAQGLGNDVCYLLDVDGTAIAAAPLNPGLMVVGNNYSSRPYFVEAVQGRPSVYIALGVTTGKRGIYIGHPVFGKHGEKPVGVLVVKSSLEDLEAEIGPKINETVMLVHDSGVIFVSGRPEWLFRLLWNPSFDEQAVIAAGGQFGKGPWMWTGLERTGPDQAVDTSGSGYLVRELELDECPGWKLVVLYGRETMLRKMVYPWMGNTGHIALVMCLVMGGAVLALYTMARRDILHRQRAEKALQRSEAGYRSIFDSMNDAIFVHDLETGQILDVNRKMSEMYGFTSGEARTLTVDRMSLGTPPYSQKEALRWMTRAAQGEPQLFEWSAKDRAGALFWTEVNLKRAVIGGQDRLLAVVRDITARKLAAKALRESEENLRTFFNSSPDLLFVLDEQGKIITANETALAGLNYTLEELRDRPFLSTRIDGDGKEAATIDDDILQGKRDYSLVPLKARNGEAPEVETRIARGVWNGQPALFAVSRDVSERRRAEEALKESEEKLRAVVHGSPIPQFFIDRERRVVYWNKALEEISGMAAEEVVGTRQHWKAFYREERPCMVDLLVDGGSESLERWYGGKWSKSNLLSDAFELTDCFQMRNNELKWLHCTGVEIRDSHGAVIGAMETLEDITERTRAEEALRVQTEKFQALSESAPFGMVVIGEDGSFEYVNPKFKEIVGYALADVPNGREWFLKAYPDPEYRREVISAWIGDLNK